MELFECRSRKAVWAADMQLLGRYKPRVKINYDVPFGPENSSVLEGIAAMIIGVRMEQVKAPSRALVVDERYVSSAVGRIKADVEDFF